MDRRAFLTGAAALVGAAALTGVTALTDAASAAAPQRPRGHKTRLILLGTAGGPRPHKGRSAPAQVVVANDMLYVVDCGNGVSRQLVLADLPLPKLRHVFITHHHSDHNADYIVGRDLLEI